MQQNQQRKEGDYSVSPSRSGAYIRSMKQYEQAEHCVRWRHIIEGQDENVGIEAYFSAAQRKAAHWCRSGLSILYATGRDVQLPRIALLGAIVQ